MPFTELFNCSNAQCNCEIVSIISGMLFSREVQLLSCMNKERAGIFNIFRIGRPTCVASELYNANIPMPMFLGRSSLLGFVMCT